MKDLHSALTQMDQMFQGRFIALCPEPLLCPLVMPLRIVVSPPLQVFQILPQLPPQTPHHNLCEVTRSHRPEVILLERKYI